MSYRRNAREAFLKGESIINGQNPKNPETNGEKEIEKDLEKPPLPTTVPPNLVSSIFSKREGDAVAGFVTLPNQVYRKAVKRGFDFNLMVVGESGLGKSTLINSLFLTEIYSSEHPGPSTRRKKTMQIEKNQVLLKEGGVHLRLTVIDTPGFGDAVDNNNCWEPILNFIDIQYENYLNVESQLNRSSLVDNRVHCCLYFIAPSGHGLKALDIEFMRHLHNRVNIVPLIAKADTLTPEESRDFKKTILNELAQNKINIYDFPISGDEEERRLLKKLKDKIPFAVVGSNTVIDVQGKKVRGRLYPWGAVEVDNIEHNDFVALRNMIVRQNMQDLKDITANVHYENFRFGKLASVSSGNAGKPVMNTANNPMLQIEEERREHVERMRKMEAEMQHVFEMKVREKLQKLKDSETDLQRRSEQMKKNLEQQEVELVERMRLFEMEQSTWEDQNKQYIQDDSFAKNKKKIIF